MRQFSQSLLTSRFMVRQLLVFLGAHFLQSFPNCPCLTELAAKLLDLMGLLVRFLGGEEMLCAQPLELLGLRGQIPLRLVQFFLHRLNFLLVLASHAFD